MVQERAKPTVPPELANLRKSFLRDRRLSIAPAEPVPRRHIKGLTREDVAVRAGISAAWYQKLEQGRPANPSLDVLDRLAGALQLNDDERVYLIGLFNGDIQGPRFINPYLEEFLADVGKTTPAFYRSRDFDLYQINDLGKSLFGELVEAPWGRVNVLWSLFSDPSLQGRFSDWRDAAKPMVTEFSRPPARHKTRPEYRRVLAHLLESSSDFKKMHSSPKPIRASSEITFLFPLGDRTSRARAELPFRRLVWVPEGEGDILMEMYLPKDPIASALLMDSLAGTRR